MPARPRDALLRRRDVTLMQTNHPSAGGARTPSPAKAWSRALELTSRIVHEPTRTFPSVIDELADRIGDAPALLSDRERLTYRELAERTHRYTRWTIDQRMAHGDVVCLLMSNRPEYMAIWLGVTRAAGVVALLNTNLTGGSLAHCINVAAPKHVIVDEAFVEQLLSALPEVTSTPTVWVHGGDHRGFERIDRAVESLGGDALSDGECQPVTIDDRALYIYTSGTTGLPKAAVISHGRIMQ